MEDVEVMSGQVNEVRSKNIRIMKTTNEIADSDEGDRDSGLMVISIPGSM